ncbi:hypothetical protein E2320_017839 [Naja naja]|nr:hypothetical protein E2320_017839 [Naja naja]
MDNLKAMKPRKLCGVVIRIRTASKNLKASGQCDNER